MTFGAKELTLNSATSMTIGQELRAIGQGLESLDVEDFDLQGEGSGYFAFGLARTQVRSAETVRFGKTFASNALQIVWQKFAGKHSLDRKLSARGPDVLRILFTPEGLLRLEAAGIAKRSARSIRVPDPRRLGQVLRMVGEGLDAKAACLVEVRKRRDRIFFEYATATGEQATEQWKISELVERWLEAFQGRQERSDLVERELSAERREPRADRHR